MDGQKILLADDQPEFLEPVRRRLEVEGYQVTTASMMKNGSSPRRASVRMRW